MLIEMIGVGGKPAIINGHEGFIFFSLSLLYSLSFAEYDGWMERKKTKTKFQNQTDHIYHTHFKKCTKKLKNFKNKTKIYSNDKHS